MVKNIRVSMTSFSGIKDSGSTEEKIKKNQEAALGQLKKAALDGLDIVCLSETFTGLSLEIKKWLKAAETVLGSATEVIAEVSSTP